MKKIVVSAIASICIGGVATAGGDFVPVVPVPIVDSWSGFYAGLQAGGVGGSADVSIPDYSSTFSVDPSGFAGGLYAGYNWLLSSNFLLGVEIEANYISADDEGFSGGTTEEKYKVEQNWDAALVARIGYVIDDQYMPYLLGGVAWTELETSYIPDGGWGKKSDTVTGWTVGAGVEMKIDENLHVRIQYRYTDYQTADFVHWGPSHVDYKDHRVMIGVSYRF